MESKTFRLEIDQKPLIVTINNLAARTNGSVFVKFGETTVLATAAMGEKDVDGLDYFPLSVNYEEKFYAGGKIFGSRFTRREGRPSDESILTSRLIDRTIRPLFPAHIKREVQITVTLLSWDEETDPSSIGIFAASLALLISDIPWNGPVAGVRIGGTADSLVAFPNYEDKKEIDLTVSSLFDRNGEVIFNMFEAQLNELSEEDVVKIVNFTKDYSEKLLNFQKEINKEVGKEKQILEYAENTEINEDILAKFGNQFEENIENKDFINSIRDYLKEKYENGNDVNLGMDFVEKQLEKALHSLIIKRNKRPDGRGLDEIRPLFSTVNYLPRVHGSGVFERGETKVLSILTLGGPGEEKLLEGVEYAGKKRFLHQYNFPPFCVGEARPARAPGRREIGHGRLGEKALEMVIPDFDKFPYTIRVVSEVLSSNGSSSMASTCAACLALMDGGVPLKEPVAGIAMGIVMEEGEIPISEKKYKILTDIQGSEDHFGDMDFKVAGTKNGVVALQMDVKCEGVNEIILKNALIDAKKARLQILQVMLSAISAPRENLSPYAPRVEMIRINPEKIGDVIGPGGKMINKIIDENDVNIEIEDSGEVYITSKNEEGMKKSIKWIMDLTAEVEKGQIYEGIVTKILDFGAIVEILPGKDGMIHISELSDKRVEKVSDVVKIGDKVKVKVISSENNGKISLSLKQAKNGFSKQRDKK